jgi:hypothetical protein
MPKLLLLEWNSISMIQTGREYKLEVFYIASRLVLEQCFSFMNIQSHSGIDVLIQLLY